MESVIFSVNICGAGQTKTYTIKDKLNVDAGKYVLAMLLN